MSSASYLGGRRPIAALGVWALCAVWGYFLWRSGSETHALDQPLPRVVPWIEPVTIISAASSGALLTARMPEIDRSSTRPVAWYAAVLAALASLAFAAVPLIPLLGIRLAPDRFPRGTLVDTSEEVAAVSEVYTPALAGNIAVSCAFFAAVSLLCVIVMGRALGVLAALGAYVVVVLLQSTRAFADWVPLLGGGVDPYAYDSWSLVWVGVAVCAAVGAWARFRGVPRPYWR